MKKSIKTIFFSLLITIGSNAFSQVTINSSHMPQVADTLRYSVAAFDANVLATYADTGASRVWNYDSLIPLRQGINEYLNSAQTPYAINGKIAVKLADTLTLSGFSLYDVYDFYTNSTNAFEINQRGAKVPFGSLTVPISPSYSDPDQVYEFPLDYLDRDSNTYNLTFTNIFPPAYYSTSGYRINEVEAWGSMTSPFGTFNCLKLKTDIITYDTVSFGTLNFGNTSHRREYKWISPQLKDPVMILSGNVVNGIFIPVNMQYRDSVRSRVPGIFSPLALFNADTTEVRIGDTLQFNNLTISVIPPTFNWTISPSTFVYVNGSNSNSAEPFVSFTDTGYYDIQLLADNGQGLDTLLREDYIHVNQALSVFKFSKKTIKNIRLYPNPLTRSQLSISSEDKIERVRLFDLSLRLIQEWKVNQLNELQLDLKQNLSESSYLLLINTTKEEIVQKLLIK